MNIIIVSDKLSAPRSYNVSHAQIAMMGVGLIIAMFVFGSIMYAFTLRQAVDAKNPYLQSVLSSLTRKESEKNQVVMRENLNALAVKLGEMQARLMRIDAFGERLSKAAGIKPTEFKFSEKPGRGGPESDVKEQSDISLEEFNRQLAELSSLLEDRSDKLGVLDSMLMQENLRKKSLPTVLPVTTGYHSSNYGYRLDPFSGRKAFHAGIDFVAPIGTSVTAAAGGVVATSEAHGEYGNMVEVDHGNGLVSRYAHLSKSLVKPGDVVLKGQQIAQVGTTGRSTGAHLHFEVRESGVALNPRQFLQIGG
jgi:murein DD-endopeptidase MepM/ murein hydrolase activator NlpD